MCHLYAAAATAGVAGMDQMTLTQALLAHIVEPVKAARADGLLMARVVGNSLGRLPHSARCILVWLASNLHHLTP